MVVTKYCRWILLFALSLVLAAPSVRAENQSGRKVVTRVNATYPDIAKRLGLSGIVRIELVVNPAGTVKTAKVLGGSPVLAQSALQAAKNWKFERADNETTEVVSFEFKKDE
jgi:TonB family protein